VNQVLDIHPLQLRVGDFIAGLQALEKAQISTTAVTEFVEQMQPSAKALAPYLLWNGERYARNLIYRDAYFEVLALCWFPGQRTPIHSHNGQLGWVTVVQGDLVCRNYKFVRSNAGSPATGGSGADKRNENHAIRLVEVELLSSAECCADGTVAVVDRRQTTHQIENLEKSRHGSVSLHVYSKPIDNCVVFDESTRCCERRELEYYSEDGIVVKKPALPQAASVWSRTKAS
jgi:cysteine dioxygenase